jgi:arginase
MKPHFFKVHSRLGMINLPNKGHELNVGVEDGADAVLNEGFLSSFGGQPQVTSFDFPLPEAVDKKNYLAVMAERSAKLADLINKNLGPDELQVVVGGDHSVAFASLLAVTKRVDPSKIGYIQFDSHGDVHLNGTSPSGNFHGMWLRPFLSDFDVADISRLIDGRLNNGQVMFIGNQELEPEEKNVFKAHQIIVVSSDDLTKSKSDALGTVKKFTNGFEHIHISFDIDVFDRQLVSATGTPAEAGMSKPEVFEILQILKPALGRSSVDLVEVNPRKPGAADTIKMAQEVLSALLS